jgi:hypothetical protein
MKLIWPLLALSFLAGAAHAAPLPTPDQVLNELNRARTDPQAYAQSLRELRRHFQGRLLHDGVEDGGIMTFEGVAAVDEAIAFLERQAPLPALDLADPLIRSAMDQARDQSRSGRIGHTGSDGSSFADRIHRQATWLGEAGEAIAYGDGGAAEVIRQLIVDDGEPDRGHRILLFSPGLRRAGVACAPHPTYDEVCVLDFAADLAPRVAQKKR